MYRKISMFKLFTVLLVGCSLINYGYSVDNSVIAASQPITFRLDACSGGAGGYTCMTKPSTCTDVNSCELIAAWAPSSDGVEFTVIGKTPGYLVVGFSDGTKMDKVKSTVCAWDGQQINIYNAYNDGYNSAALQAPYATSGISHAHGQYINGRLSCRFVRAIVSSDSDRVARLDASQHVFLGSGPMDGPLKIGMHFEDPVVSGLQNLNQPSVSGRVTAADDSSASRPYWKAHGILMIIAWVLIALAGTLQPRYYRQMWPNNRPCGLQMWFAIHRPIMLIATALFTIAFILALVATGGKYRQSNDLPQKAHPILGLIALILGWANPIIALIRCNPAAHYRPIFNWIHFTVGTIAIVFAVTNCFIGLSFASVRAPIWTGWVLVVAVIFHLIVEIVLELAGCFYYAKNKEKNEQFELRQQALSNGQGLSSEPEPTLAKPEPAGRLFKVVILGLHSIVMTTLVLAIVIGVAIG